MADGDFGKTLAGFRDWAGTTERELSGDPEEVAGELAAVFDLMPDYLGIDSPSRLNAGLLNDLLLDVYPRKVTVLDPEDAKDTVPAVRDLVSYLADTRQVTDTAARAMRRELDEIEPEFADAVMDPSNWGPATAMMHAMHRDGVDFNDKAAVDAWIAQQNASGFAGAPGVFGSGPEMFPDPEDDPASWDGIGLADAFDIPDVVAPIRLPDDEALAAQAVAAPLLADLLGLARDVRERPVPADSVDPLLRDLAVECELVELDDDALLPGEDVAWLDDLGEDDPDALGVWGYAFGEVLDTTLEAVDLIEPQVGEELDLTGHGIALVMDLFLGARAGVPVAELSQRLKGAAVAELPAAAAEREWEEWTGAHGDPASLLLGQLAKLSAVTVADEVARLEPLALFAVGASCGRAMCMSRNSRHPTR
ncbi:MAG: hypothetical protein ACRDN0_38225 [Trebonia sp.]